jgi:hypothetical protein
MSLSSIRISPAGVLLNHLQYGQAIISMFRNPESTGGFISNGQHGYYGIRLYLRIAGNGLSDTGICY